MKSHLQEEYTKEAQQLLMRISACSPFKPVSSVTARVLVYEQNNYVWFDSICYLSPMWMWIFWKIN